MQLAALQKSARPAETAAVKVDGVVALTGDHVTHHCDGTITMYATDSGLFRGKLIAASSRMRAYAIKKSLIRVIDSAGVYRLLLKGHDSAVVDLAVWSLL